MWTRTSMLDLVSDGQSRQMLQKWKKAVQVVVWMWGANKMVLSIMTPRLLTWVCEGNRDSVSDDGESRGVMEVAGSEFGAHEQGLGFIAIEFEKLFGHPVLDVLAGRR